MHATLGSASPTRVGLAWPSVCVDTPCQVTEPLCSGVSSSISDGQARPGRTLELRGKPWDIPVPRGSGVPGEGRPKRRPLGGVL